MAAGVAAGRSAGAATRLLAQATGGRAACPGVADRLSTAGGENIPRGGAGAEFALLIKRRAEGVESKRRCDAVHEFTGGVSSPAPALQRTGGHCGRDTGGPSDKSGDRRDGRVFSP